MKTREVVQREAKNAIKGNNYIGTIVMDTGTGKAKTAIDVMEDGQFKNVLITSPRTVLKENWSNELEKWGYVCMGDKLASEALWRKRDYLVHIVMENIQTTYKWSEKKELLEGFDFVIMDEIHLGVTEEYGKLLIAVAELDIARVGLSATPEYAKHDKRAIYNSYLPIMYIYLDAAEHGIINKRKYIVCRYSLTNDFKVEVGTRHKRWLQGELTQSIYWEKQLVEAQRVMTEIGSTKWFEDAAKWVWKHEGNEEQKAAGSSYLRAIKGRKKFLHTLQSSIHITTILKNYILTNPNNKVLVFSELTEQANKLSKYTVHSNNPPDINTDHIKRFDKGEIRELTSCNSLTMGLNLKGANYAIMESYVSSDTLFKQKAGRTDRLEADDIATIIWIVPKNTQAETWHNIVMRKVKRPEVEYFDLDKEEDIESLANELLNERNNHRLEQPS